MPSRRVASALLALAMVLPAGVGTSNAEPARTWKAEPAWVANHGVYRDREFVYQDYVYDDHGANTDGVNRRDLPFGAWPNPRHPRDQRWSPTGGSVRYTGDFMYPAEGNHMANVADLIEFRMAATADDVYLHVRLGDMHPAWPAVVALCIDRDADVNTGLSGGWPHGVGLVARTGCEQLVTAWATGATITDGSGATTDIVTAGGALSVDAAEATMDLRIPRGATAPGETWRITGASGLWDAEAGRWLQVTPGPQSIGASIPTGGGVGVPHIWDLLSNNDEPNSYWLEERQANDLARHLVSDHHITVSLDRLAIAVDDADPELTGFVPRIYRSQFPMQPERGITISRSTGTNFIYNGPYQPYAMVVPSSYYRDGRPQLPFDQCLHPLNGNHMVEVYYSEAFARDGYNPLVTGTTSNTGYLGFGAIEGLYDRLNTLYACVLGRGEGVGYTGGAGMLDALEVAADVARHYNVDPDRRTLHGISLGAIGTWYIAPLYPDRFSAIMPTIFTPSLVNTDFSMLRNLYNVPVFWAMGTGDQFAQGPQGEPTADALEAAGVEHVYLHYLGRQHEGRIHGDTVPFQEALGFSRTRVTDPPRVRFRFDPARYNAKMPGDGAAYWVRAMTPRGNGAAEIDVTSLARADELPAKQVVIDGLYANDVQNWEARFRGLFRMSEAEFRAMWHPEQWEPGWRELHLTVDEQDLVVPAVTNGFVAALGNLGAVALDGSRMAIDANEVVTASLTGDGTTTVSLSGGFPSSVEVLLDGSPVAADVKDGTVTVTLDLTPGTAHTLEIVPA